MRKEMLWAMLLVPLMALSLVNTIKATPSGSTMYVYNEHTFDPTLTPGSILTIGVGIDYGEAIWGYQIEMTFNPGVLNVVSYDDAGFIGSAGAPTKWIPGQGFDNTIGKLYLFGAAQDNMKDPTKAPTGGGILAIITFEVVGTGSSNLNIGPDSDSGVQNVFWDPATQKYATDFIVHGDPPIGQIVSGYFASSLGLYATGGGSGTWEAWQVGVFGAEQTLYSRIARAGYGDPVTIRVRFQVLGPGGLAFYWSREAPLLGKDKGPGEVTVSASFVPGPPGKYYYSAVLEFKVPGMTDFVSYSAYASELGGTSASKSTSVGFKVTK